MPTLEVPFFDLSAVHRELGAEIDEALRRVVNSGQFILGSEVESFEQEFAAYCGVEHCIGVGSGLDALTLGLLAAGIGPGDEVITVANTFVATIFAIARTGAKPVLVDCDPDTFCLDPQAVSKAVSQRTRALLPVHLYDRLASIDQLRDLAHQHDLIMIEDAAQAHGASRGGQRAGSFGLAGCFSFYPAKNLGAFGDGGAVMTSSAGLAAEVRLLRSYGEMKKGVHTRQGFNSRLDALQAAVLRTKLPQLDAWNASRREAALLYDHRLADLDFVKRPALPENPDEHVHHLYVIRVPDRDGVRTRLAELGISTGIHYPLPVHLQEAFIDLGYEAGSFPNAEKFASEILSLPLFPGMTADQVEAVVQGLVSLA